MSLRNLDLGWSDVAARLGSYQGPVVMAWASQEDDRGAWTPLAVTVRAGIELPSRDHRNRLRIVRQQFENGGHAAYVVRSGAVLHSGLPFPAPSDSDASKAVWLTQGTWYGPLAPIASPRLCHWYSWAHTIQNRQDSLLTSPLAARGQPYYPTARDAMLEISHGRTDRVTRIDLLYRLDVSIAYDTVYLASVGYVDGQGLVTNVAESRHGAAAGHVLQVVWQLHQADSELGRWNEGLTAGGPHVVDIGAPPLYYAVALLDPSGGLLDEVEGAARIAQPDIVPLPSLALPDAFDFLDSAWGNLFPGHHLIERPLLRSPADLTQPVGSQEDFSSRLTHLDMLMKSLRVEDSLLPPSRKGRALDRSASLARMRAVLRSELHADDVPVVEAAVGVLGSVNAVRVALQHKIDPPKRADLPIALAQLGIEYPPHWPLAWEIVRHRVVEALTDIRQALLASRPVSDPTESGPRRDA